MRARSICILSIVGLLGLVLAVQAHAQGMTPGQAAPPLQNLDLTKPGPRPSAVTQQAAPPAPATAAPAPATGAPTAKPTPATAKAGPVKSKPAAVAAKRTPVKAPPKAAKGGKPVKKTPGTQTATTGDR